MNFLPFAEKKVPFQKEFLNVGHCRENIPCPPPPPSPFPPLWLPNVKTKAQPNIHTNVLQAAFAQHLSFLNINV